MSEIERKESEIDNLLNEVSEQIAKGGSKYPGMTYEDGIDAAIRWLTDKDKDNPME